VLKAWRLDDIPSPVSQVFAVIRLVESTQDPLASPDRLPCLARIGDEVLVPLVEVPRDRCLGVGYVCVITVVDNRSRHPAENGLDDIQELGV
jgi:hypothetical protein